MNESKDESVEENRQVWVENPHGVQSSLTFKQAKKFVEKRHGWKFIPPQDVTDKKQFPLSDEMTESGERRRDAVNAKRKKDEANPPSKEEVKLDLNKATIDDIRLKAKRMKIDHYWNKSKARLIKEITDGGL